MRINNRVDTMLFSLVLLSLLFSRTLCDYADNNNHRQVVAMLDTSAIYEGIFKPENIAIHVVQNLVNFVASTLAWSFLMHLYQVGFILSYSFDYLCFTPKDTDRQARVKREDDRKLDIPRETLSGLLRIMADTSKIGLGFEIL